MSTFHITKNGADIAAIERDEMCTVVSARSFASRRMARNWILARVDAQVRAEQEAIRREILRVRLAA